MRGKLASRLLAPACVRITPAGAGKTRQDDTCRLDLRDHPRRCGENRVGFALLSLLSGSPPQVRGKLVMFFFLFTCIWDHPRRCGENRTRTKSNQRAPGSPPRMRGKPCSVAHFLPPVRITPADAGKTSNHSLTKNASSDHPRGCGENNHVIGKRNSATGSPPRMRGKQSRRRGTAPPPGITPADAGKTAVGLIGLFVILDHPRGCGENVAQHSLSCAVAGSPPRMRGKPAFLSREPNPSGITPADAGKT